MAAPDIANLCSRYEDLGRSLFTCQCSKKNPPIVNMSCVDGDFTCNSDGSLCYRRNWNILMHESLSIPKDITRGSWGYGYDATYNVTSVETCTAFTDAATIAAATTRSSNPLSDKKNEVLHEQDPQDYFSVAQTGRFVHPAGNKVCITTRPTVVNDFTQGLRECEATMNGHACGSCSLCDVDDDDTHHHITFDCCNVKPDFRATCHPVGADGTIVPTFDLAEGAEPTACNYASIHGEETAAGTGSSPAYSYYTTTNNNNHAFMTTGSLLWIPYLLYMFLRW